MIELPMEGEPVRVIQGDALDIARGFPSDSFDAVVTDPPAAITFMGRKWDHDHGGRTQWVKWLAGILEECLRVTKPGGRLFCWALPRTAHWTACAVEDAGWHIENKIYHLFGSGFPKGKSQLKPAAEEWILARKPGPRVLPLGIEECRVACGERPNITSKPKNGAFTGVFRKGSTASGTTTAGRWPANLVHDGSPEVMEAFAAFGERGDGSKGRTKKSGNTALGRMNDDSWQPRTTETPAYSDTGTAARFFAALPPDGDDLRFNYCPKANKKDRGDYNKHNTVKPTSLMRWLVKLVSQPGDLILDPFAGSGSTGKACALEGRRCVLIEEDAAHCETARKRVAEALGTDTPNLLGTI